MSRSRSVLSARSAGALDATVGPFRGAFVANEAAPDALVEAHHDQLAGERRTRVGRDVVVRDLVVDRTRR